MVRRRTRDRSRRASLQSSGPAGAGSRNGASSLREPRLVGERKRLGRRLEEEVERIDHRHLGDQIDVDGELARLLRKDEAREVVAVRILLPVEEVLRGSTFSE